MFKKGYFQALPSTRNSLPSTRNLSQGKIVVWKWNFLWMEVNLASSITPHTQKKHSATVGHRDWKRVVPGTSIHKKFTSIHKKLKPGQDCCVEVKFLVDGSEFGIIHHPPHAENIQPLSATMFNKGYFQALPSTRNSLPSTRNLSQGKIVVWKWNFLWMEVNLASSITPHTQKTYSHCRPPRLKKGTSRHFHPQEIHFHPQET